MQYSVLLKWKTGDDGGADDAGADGGSDEGTNKFLQRI
jgi:hypothetical protein